MQTKGFTIIETLVAIAVIMLAIVGPLTIANKGLVAAISARDQVTANYLAQDALEYLKNIRDNNLLAAVDWMRGINESGMCEYSSSVPANSKSCFIETATVGNLPEVCPGAVSDCGHLYYNESTKSYTHAHPAGTVATPFTRYYQVDMKNTSGTDYDDARVEVVVTWKTGTVVNKLSVKNNFFKVLRY